MKETAIHQETVFSGRVLHVRVDKVELENGRQSTREICLHPGGVGVLPLTEDGQVVLVQQFRYAYGEELWEIPAGKLERGEEPAVCGARELKEETGYTAKELIPLGCIYPSPGYVDERLYIFLAKGLSEGEATPDEEEFVNVKKIPFEDLLAQVMRDEIHDGKTVTAVLKTARILEEEQHG